MRLKYHAQLLQMKEELVLAKNYASTRLKYDADKSVMDIMLSLDMPGHHKEHDDLLFNCLHFKSLFGTEYPSEFDMRKLDEWINAINFIVYADHNYMLNKPKYKPTAESIVEMFTAYKQSILIQIQNYSALLSNPHTKTNTKNKLSMCDTYIDRFSTDNDWPEKLSTLLENVTK